jgi:hypothetical protein
MRLVLLTICLAALLHSNAVAKTQRSNETRLEFQRQQPCPSTGKTTGACPGYVKDHIVPLCKGGADEPWNLQWQTVEDAKAKDKWECKP